MMIRPVFSALHTLRTELDQSANVSDSQSEASSHLNSDSQPEASSHLTSDSQSEASSHLNSENQSEASSHLTSDSQSEASSHLACNSHDLRNCGLYLHLYILHILFEITVRVDAKCRASLL